ncbi:MAG: glycosyltransferase family 39 protein, partial [Chloroflexota bacterium]
MRKDFHASRITYQLRFANDATAIVAGGVGHGYNPSLMARLKQLPLVWSAVAFMLLFYWLALNSLVWDSPTMDEQNHLARGLAFLRTGDPRLSLEHPPLVNSLSALPLLTMPEVALPLDDPSWQRQPPDVYWYIFADQLLWQTNQAIPHYVERMIFLARLPVVFMTLGLALTGFHFAREAWGRPAALSALALLLFEPNLLANGRYITTDLGGTLFLFLAVYLLWRLWRVDGWSWRRWGWAALGLGLAFGSKLSTLIFVPILAGTAVLPLYGSAWRGWARRLLQFLTAGLLSILVVWAIFGFEWGPFWFQAGPLAFLNQFSGPMPTFWAGIAQIADLGSGGRASFLMGQFSTDGFLAYFPVAFAVKTPLVILLLLALALVVLLGSKEKRGTAVFLLIPPLLYFLFNLNSGLNIGYRHLLPML